MRKQKFNYRVTEREAKIKMISDWEADNYQLPPNYKYRLADQTAEQLKAKLSEMAEWRKSGGVATFGGEQDGNKT